METSDEKKSNCWLIIEHVYLLGSGRNDTIYVLKRTCSGCGLGSVIDFYFKKCCDYVH